MLRQVTILCVVAATFGSHLQSVASPDGRIVGGKPALIEDHPYQLSLLIGGLFECGAIVISPLWALTAAQCAGGTIANMELRAGSVRHDAAAMDRFNVVQKVVHLNYDSASGDYDIALLRVDSSFLSDPAKPIAPIALPTEVPTIVEGTATIVTGWGVTLPGGVQSAVLRQVEVPTVSETRCKELLGDTAITRRMFCAGNLAEGGVDACQGDAGGPLVVKDSDPPLLLGIVSWGRGCGLVNSPHVYTNVTEFRNWILINSGV